MSTTIEQPLTSEEIASLMIQFERLSFEQRKLFLMEHKELLRVIKPHELFYDEIISVPSPKQ